MRKFIILALIPMLVSCGVFKKTCTETIYDTVQVVTHRTVTDTVTITNHKTVTDTIPIYKTVVDTAGIVYASRRDTIAIFKSLGIFFGSTSDSVSYKDKFRYFNFEVFNYTDKDYAPMEDAALNIQFDLEINKIIKLSDTTRVEGIRWGHSRQYHLKFPVEWFTSKPLPANWNYRDLDLNYHYRLKLTDQDGNGRDAWYPRPINEKLPVKKYRDVEKDTVMYWVRPIIKDTAMTVKRPVYAYQDSLIFIDNILGCKVYSHIFFGGNKIYSFIADTCTKRLYSGTGMTDNQTNGITAMVIKAFKNDVDTATLKVYVNDTIVDHMRFDQKDSVYVYLITKSFRNIKSVSFSSLYKVTIQAVLLNNLDLLSQPVTISGGVTKINTGAYQFVPSPVSGLLANWKFNMNGNDVTGKYPATVSIPTEMFVNNEPCEGTTYISFQNNKYFANCGSVPIGNEFTISFWFMSYNTNATNRPLFGNGAAYFPNGYVAFLDEVGKTITFCTGDGTNRNSMFTTDGSWISGKWNHAIVTGSRLTGQGKFYVNGVDRTRGSSTGIFKTFPTSFPLFIGKSSDGGLAWAYMDDVRIYNRILTPSELITVFSKKDIAGAATTENKIKITLP
jgi:hypothetical protein